MHINIRIRVDFITKISKSNKLIIQKKYLNILLYSKFYVQKNP